MEPWDLSKYGRPYLAVDDISADEDAKSVTVAAFGESYDISAPELGVTDLAQRLQELREPGEPLWRRLRSGPATADEPLRQLLANLDTLGLILNADDGGARTAHGEERALRSAVDELSGWLLDPAAPWDRETIATRVCAVLSRDHHPGDGGLPTVTMRGQTDFPLTTLALQRWYWRANAPLSATSVDLLFARVLDEDAARPSQALNDLAGGPESIKDAITAAYAAASLLALSTLPDAARAAAPPVTDPGRISGINLALESERTVRAVLEQIGQPRYVSALERGKCPKSYIRGAFVEDYFVNLRFLETICPALVRRFREPLRSRLFAYYNEEFGHEDLERATCLSLGLTGQQIDAYVPLPYHSAYVDAFVAIAQANPVAYLVSVMVTEGLPGEPYGLNDLIDVNEFGPEFAAVFRQHEQVNTDMKHETLARHLLAEVPSVSPGQRATALDCTAYLTELTHRAWDVLFDLHSGGPAVAALPPLYAKQL